MKLSCLLCDAFFDTDDYDTIQTTYLTCPACREQSIVDAKAEAVQAKPTKRKQKPNPKVAEIQKALKAQGVKVSAKDIRKAFPSVLDTQKNQVSAIRRKARKGTQ